MITYADQLHYRALKELTEAEIDRMKHCVGYNRTGNYRGCYHRGGVRYFKPYRNYYYAGGKDIPIWEKIEEKGFAESAKKDKTGCQYFWLNHSGLNILSAALETYIYSENARGNEIDASSDIIEILLADHVFCGYGCWLPSGSRSISLRSRIPRKLTLSTLRYLQDKCGYVRHVYEGGCDDEGFPHCTHGWVLTKKWIDENKERYDKAQKEEYKRIDASLKESDEEWERTYW